MKRTGWFLALGAMCTVAVACGSDDDGGEASNPTASEAAADTTTGDTATAGTDATDTTDEPSGDATDGTDAPAAADGEPIKVMAIGTESSSTFGFPEGTVGAQARADAINAAGGINGRPIELLHCNDQRDANAAAACARDAVDQEVEAAVVWFSAFGTNINPILAEAGIPNVGISLAVPDDFITPNGFAVDSGGVGPQAAASIALVEDGCTNIAVVASDSPAGASIADAGVKGAQSAGGDGSYIAVAPETPDYAPVVASAIADGADCFAIVLGPGELIKLVGAVRQSELPDAKIGANIAAVPAPVIEALGENAEGIVTTATWLLTDEVTDEVATEMAAIDDTMPQSDASIRAWTALYVIGEVAASIDDVTTESLTEALNSAVVEVPTVGTLDFTQPGPSAAYERLFNTMNYVYDIVDGAPVLRDETGIDVRDALAS